MQGRTLEAVDLAVGIMTAAVDRYWALCNGTYAGELPALHGLTSGVL